MFVKIIYIMFYLQAIDITDPNPIALLMLCVHLYQKIPQFLPKATVEFSGRLHTTVCRQVQYSPQVVKSTDQAVRVIRNRKSAGHF